MKKTLALLLAAVMVLGLLAGCVQDPNTGTSGTNPTNPTGNNPTDPTTPNAPATYTYNTSASIFAASWNPHTYEESTAGDMLGYLTDGFYSFDYNEDETGFAMVPAMTTDDHPIDITSEYVGQYGIKEGDTQMVYKINLRDDLRWDNGDKITAYDFVESAKRLLEPAAQNYRADSMYTGDVVIYNAQNYLKQGQSGWFAASTAYSVYSADMDGDLIFSLAPPSDEIKAENYIRGYFGFPASYDAAACAAYLIANYLGEGAFNADTAAAMEGKTLAEIKADATLNAAWEHILGWWQTEPNEELHFLITEYTYPEMEWDGNVGLFALSETELVYVITSPLEGFYLKYGMPSGYLVHLKTYDDCLTIDPETGVYSSTYYTSVETSPSYGVYSLTKYQDKKEIEYTRNENWYGLEEDTYQTTHIHVEYVENDATRLNLLLEGKLDIYGLTANDFETYGMSDYTYYSEGASTFAITFNPDLDALTVAQNNAGENINKTIITLIEFRQAMSFGLDRPSFTAATDPAGVTAFGLFTNQHIIDPELGLGYRSSEQAKDVLVEFWGLADDIGEGKLYADKDEAIASLTGYNPDMAKQLFDQAYDKAVAEGLMDENDIVEIKIGLPRADSTFYNNGYTFIENHYTELVKGTKLEGKLRFTRDDTLGENYSSALQSNQVDMLFGVGWQGMELNPYGLIMAYMTSQYQYDTATDYTVQEMTVEVEGKAYTATVHEWYEIINGSTHTITDAEGNSIEYTCGSTAGKYEERLTILAGIEKAVLLNYCFIPMNGDAGAQLKGMQIEYYHEEYMFGMGFGGIKYMTYNYTDAEWDAFVAENGGELNYK